MRNKIKKSGYRVEGIECRKISFAIACIFFTIAYTLHHTPCLYGKGTGTTAGVTLLSAGGVRQMALGNSGSSLGGDVYSAFYNPAGIADISAKQLSTFFMTGLSDDYKASIIYGLPVQSHQPARRLSGGKGGLAFGVFHLNGGKMEINYVDGISRNVISESDFLAFFGWGGYWSKNVSVGYNFKYLSTKLVEDYSASAIAFDMGIQLKSNPVLNMGEKLKIGISGQNYGTSLKYRSKKESLPFSVRTGISYNFPLTLKSAATLLVIIDGFYIMKEKDFYSSAGLEYSVYSKYLLRGGVKIMPDRNDFTLGAGFRFSERYSIDWATELSELNNPHNVSFTMRFGPERKEIPQQQEVKKPKKLREKPKKKVEEKMNLAVADFVGKNISAADASIVTDFLRTELVKTGEFNVVEKANMDKILAEAAFQQSGCTTSECAVQIGKILNVQQMVVGSLSKLMETYFITANLVDVETGKILKSENIKAYSVEELNDACKTLANKLAR